MEERERFARGCRYGSVRGLLSRVSPTEPAMYLMGARAGYEQDWMV